MPKTGAGNQSAWGQDEGQAGLWHCWGRDKGPRWAEMVSWAHRQGGGGWSGTVAQQLTKAIPPSPGKVSATGVLLRHQCQEVGISSFPVLYISEAVLFVCLFVSFFTVRVLKTERCLTISGVPRCTQHMRGGT